VVKKVAAEAHWRSWSTWETGLGLGVTGGCTVWRVIVHFMVSTRGGERRGVERGKWLIGEEMFRGKGSE
jgi:hypothetical protein